MDILKKTLAPITDGAWKEITEQMNAVLKVNLTARKFVDIEGPYGLEQGGISTGRLHTPKNQTKQGINYGIRDVIPFIEVRKPFELSVWELDNIERGAKDIDLAVLNKAAIQLAHFEDKAIYSGFKDGEIKGLEGYITTKPATIPEDPNGFLKMVGAEIAHLQQDSVEGPYSIILSDRKWQELIQLTKGYPLLKQLQELIQGQVIINHQNKNCYLVSERGGDFELALGQDISLGYDGHNNDKVKLFLTESFTFRVLSPEAFRVLTA